MFRTSIYGKRARVLAVVLASVAATAPAWAEVMDKELSVPAIWTWSILGSILGVVVIRIRWWIGLVSLPLPLVAILAALAEWNDPFVGPAIAREAGPNYGRHTYLALGILLASHVGAWSHETVRRWRQRRPLTTS